MTRPIMSADEVSRALARMSHEIVERHGGTEGLALVGVETRGVPLAHRIGGLIEAEAGVPVPVGSVDISFHRDDRDRTAHSPVVHGAHLPFDLDAMTVVIVDDVLYTGRTTRAAIDTLIEVGRPRAVRLAVLIDRGHRELPIRPDHVGKNVPTSREEAVAVRIAEVDGGEDAVVLEQPALASS